MHIHNVYFWLKADVTDSEKKEFESGLTELIKMPLISEAYWGVPAGVDREVVDGSFDYTLTMFFETREKHDVYQVDPEHKKFIDQYSHLWDNVKVLDTKASDGIN
ncbi:Dabb family protein [candidate division KSB1 bacterium]|nr:Dabb family protein [candidate division KSB1 bacterium]